LPIEDEAMMNEATPETDHISLEAFRVNFPSDEEVPDELVRLLEYQNQASRPYCTWFELIADDLDSAVIWFDGDTTAASQFTVFGHGPDGSLYAYWLYDGRTLTTAPIVVLDSEGANNQVLTSMARSFLALLAIPYDPRWSDEDVEEWKEDETSEGEQINRVFHAWLQTEFSITAPTDPATLISDAQREHPDLDAWVKARVDQHFT